MELKDQGKKTGGGKVSKKGEKVGMRKDKKDRQAEKDSNDSFI